MDKKEPFFSQQMGDFSRFLGAKIRFSNQKGVLRFFFWVGGGGDAAY